MKRTFLCMLLPACGLGLDSTVADEDVLLGPDGASQGLNDGDRQPLELDGVYEATSGFVIDVDAIDGNNGSVFASDICEGSLTIEIDLSQTPPVFGKGDCTLQAWNIDGRGEITGEVDPFTGESYWIHLPELGHRAGQCALEWLDRWRADYQVISKALCPSPAMTTSWIWITWVSLKR